MAIKCSKSQFNSFIVITAIVDKPNHIIVQIDAIFEAVSLAIGNEVYEALCDLEDKIGQETGEDQSGIEEEILDFIKRDTAWACIERLLGEKGFFSRILEINQTGHWACSWVGKFPKGNFIIL